MIFLKYYKNIIFDFVNGIYSSIPLCCVVFFIKKSIDDPSVAYNVALERGEDVTLIVNEKGIEAMKFNNTIPIDYVQCDCCYKNGVVKTIKNNGMIMKWMF